MLLSIAVGGVLMIFLSRFDPAQSCLSTTPNLQILEQETQSCWKHIIVPRKVLPHLVRYERPNGMNMSPHFLIRVLEVFDIARNNSTTINCVCLIFCSTFVCYIPSEY